MPGTSKNVGPDGVGLAAGALDRVAPAVALAAAAEAGVPEVAETDWPALTVLGAPLVVGVDTPPPVVGVVGEVPTVVRVVTVVRFVGDAAAVVVGPTVVVPAVAAPFATGVVAGDTVMTVAVGLGVDTVVPPLVVEDAAAGVLAAGVLVVLVLVAVVVGVAGVDAGFAGPAAEAGFVCALALDAASIAAAARTRLGNHDRTMTVLLPCPFREATAIPPQLSEGREEVALIRATMPFVARLLSVAALALVAGGVAGGFACGHGSSSASSGDDGGGPFTGRPGDLGTGQHRHRPQRPERRRRRHAAVGPRRRHLATGELPRHGPRRDGRHRRSSGGRRPTARPTSRRTASTRAFASTRRARSPSSGRPTRARRPRWVAYGDSPTQLDHFVQGVDFVNPPQPLDILPYPLLAHEVHVCGLQPDHTYYYAVGGDGWYGNVYSLTTGPADASSEDFRFLVMGDSNAFYDLYASLQVAAGTYAPLFTLFTGDLVHEGEMASEWEELVRGGRQPPGDRSRR